MFLVRKKKKGKLFFLVIFLLILSGMIYYLYNLNIPVSKNFSEKKFVVQSGEGIIEISRHLEKENLIRNSLMFQLYSWSKGISRRLQSGEYFFATNLSIKQIAQILARGETRQEKTLTFIEGWNNQQFAQYLAKQGFGQKEDFFAVVQKKSAFWDGYEILANRPKDRDLEGYLFPDTYRVYNDATIVDIVRKMLDNFDKKFTDEMRSAIAKQGKDIHEIVTLASIIEKEVAADYDRRLVADIFYKRLEKGIALQSDATINYITGKGTTRPTLTDLDIDNPYNTYKYKGLPPGPISNPGLSAIMAAIYPLPNSYWYFLTTPDGKVIYSKTYEEHLAAKAKYY